MVTIIEIDTGKVIWQFEKDTRKPDANVYTNVFEFSQVSAENGKMSPVMYETKIQLSSNFNLQDEYYILEKLAATCFALRFWVYPIGVISFITMIATFVYLMSASGRRPDSTEVHPGWGTAVPFDITTVAAGGASVGLIYIYEEMFYYAPVWAQMLGICGMAMAMSSMLLGWCMSFALRIKLGKWWKNTVVYYALVYSFRAAKAVGRAIGRFIGMIPLVWRTIIALAIVAVVEIVVILGTEYDIGLLVVLWCVGKVIQIPLVLYIAITLKKLKKGGDALAEGDLSYVVNTKHMLWDFKGHGENLNSIGAGMNRAVEQRLKSERMKTELITNVSHDIKTPLTSIINYSDLICKEECNNEKITEYADVLHRQSERLKRLIEDLVEASKASTGNLEVNLTSCEIGVMLTQTAGEYEQKLDSAGLELITTQPEKPVVIMADGRRLWRVFDNLMNNLIKYSMPNTRVYLTLEETAGEAIISFKNISKAPLNISAEELMERFVRGDASRNTEGNGLGLSIARSLTELQGGKMEITTDGDLFKVVLRFPVIR